MTRKDYVKFAVAIRETKTAIEHLIQLYTPLSAPEALGMLEAKLTDIFAWDNPKFDRERFCRACEPKESK